MSVTYVSHSFSLSLPLCCQVQYTNRITVLTVLNPCYCTMLHSAINDSCFLNGLTKKGLTRIYCHLHLQYTNETSRPVRSFCSFWFMCSSVKWVLKIRQATFQKLWKTALFLAVWQFFTFSPPLVWHILLTTLTLLFIECKTKNKGLHRGEKSVKHRNEIK